MSRIRRTATLVGGLVVALVAGMLNAAPAYAIDLVTCLSDALPEISVSPASILNGQTTTVRWNAGWPAASCAEVPSANHKINGIGDVGSHGSAIVQPSGNTSFRLLIRNGAGSKGSEFASVTLPGGPSYVSVVTSESVQMRTWELGISGLLWGQRVVGPLSPARQVLGSGDFDGDSDADLLMRDNLGDVWIGVMHARVMVSQFKAGTNPGATVLAIADLNQDGVDDVLWRQPPAQPGGDRETFVWLHGRQGFAREMSYMNIGLGNSDALHFIGVGKFNSTGWLDLVWEFEGDVNIWFFGESGWLSEANAGFAPATLRPQGAGDFEGDGQADILWRDENDRLSIWIDGLRSSSKLLSWHNIASNLVPPEWLVKGMADVNNDGHTDVVFHRPIDGHLAVWMVHSGNYLHDAYPGSTGTANFETILADN